MGEAKINYSFKWSILYGDSWLALTTTLETLGEDRWYKNETTYNNYIIINCSLLPDSLEWDLKLQFVFPSYKNSNLMVWEVVFSFH